MPASKQEVLKERRAERRVSLVVEISCRSENAFGFGKTENISEAGLLVISPHILPLGAEVEVRFVLLVGFEAVPVRAEAKVAWVRVGATMGIQFLDLKDEYREAIAKFVEGG